MTGRRTIAGRSIRWDQHRADRAYADGWWSRERVGDRLAQAAAVTPDRVLIADGEHSITCSSLHRRASQLAAALAGRFAPGSVISFMLPNWHEAAEIYLAAMLSGMVAHPILPQLREHDLAFMLADADSRMIFIPAKLRGRCFRTMLAAVTSRIDRSPEVVVLRGEPLAGQSAYGTLGATIGSAAVAPQPADPDSVSMILYTSGTTGLPKGVMHTQNTLGALVRQLARHWLIEPGDVFLVPSPVSHIGGSIYTFEMPIMLGTKAVLVDRWDADTAVSMVRAGSFTHLAGATPFLEQLLVAAREVDSRLPALKVFICGGASVPPDLIEAAVAQFERAVVTRVYGSTEVPVITVGVLGRSDVAHAAHTDGRVGMAEVRLAPSAVAGAEEDIGELFARGPQMLVGYIHAEDEETVFDAEGFYRTGDIGQIVDGAFLRIVGRIKDIIIRNGENIAPKEVEDALRSHPQVGEIAIVGLPDTRTGERACAVVVPRAAAIPDLPSLTAFLVKLGFASFKLPEQLEIWSALPKNPTGKVLKHEITATLRAAAMER